MEERQLTSRGGSLKLNLGMIGVVGVQKESLLLMVLVFGEPYDKAGQPFQNPFSSRLVLVIELYFGIMCGVGVVLFGRHFRNSITLVVIRSLLLMMLCTFLIRGFTGIFNFLGLHKIGKRNTSTPF